jgi:hypothetical protein
MLLLFWRSLGLMCGNPNDIRWYHDPSYVPRCFVTGEYGLSVINPFMNYTAKECGYVLLDSNCTSVEFFNDNLILGTTTSGLYQLNWSLIKNNCNSVENPYDFSNSMELFTTFSGLLAQEIKTMASSDTKLAVVTPSGLSIGTLGSVNWVNYLTTSGAAAAFGENIYFAEGNTLNVSSNFPTWNATYEFNYAINELWCTTQDGVDTLFMATESGVVVKENEEFYYFNTTSGIKRARPEVGTTMNQGHVFAMISGTLNVYNMRNKVLESEYNYATEDFLFIDNKRIGQK